MTALPRIRGFSHVCVGVSDLERALAFYRDGLGLRVIFDVELDGPGMESVTGEAGARGRMVGCLVPGSLVTIELLWFAHRAGAAAQARRSTGYTNVSLAVADLDAAYAALVARGVRPLQRRVKWAASAVLRRRPRRHPDRADRVPGRRALVRGAQRSASP